ncbi:MAG: alpha-D-ribose 1-methylphosphonate 5-triphosphate diphosphatase [Gammaproteobacteria bacterium]|nr:alpha-D-ribose 1-methylphosphonate 5-triphosphate diphosphatase [Gammaproteobacteria bacterium]
MTASTSDSHLLTNARIVTPEWDDLGSVLIEGGRIVDVLRGRCYRAGTDLGGLWLTPGCIDIHSDYLERELRPRPSAEFPLPLAFHFMDQRAMACGLTTVLSAVSFTDKTEAGRGFEPALDQARFIDELVDGALARHWLHARLDPNTDEVLDHLEALAGIASLKLVVYNDSIPGERQFRYEDLVRKRAESMGIPENEARVLLDRQIAERSAVDHRAAIAARLADTHVIGSHDDTTVAHVDEAKAHRATLAEMPTTLEAAQRARELGLWVCMGAPNYVRGGSHCGNLACSEALEAGVVDMICSDYHFPSMHAAIVRMMADGITPSRCFDLVARNPARLLGLDQDLGAIEPGLAADLVAFEAHATHARVAAVWVAGQQRLRIGERREAALRVA